MKIIKVVKEIILCLGLVCLAACGATTESITTVGNPANTGTSDTGGTGGTGTGGTGTEESATTDTVFYDAVLAVAPSFAKAGSSSSLSPKTLVTTTWESGNPLYGIFYILRSFNPDTDQGVIDTSNLYHTIWEARGFFSRTKGNCDTIAEQVIAPPFDFGNTPTTYTCAFNEEASDGYDFGGAYKELDENGKIIAVTTETRKAKTATEKFGVFGFVWAGSHNEYGSMQASYNSATAGLSTDIAVWVDYDDEDDYCYRNDIDGNTGTHFFTLRSIKGNKVPGSTFTSVVGKGYSEGTDKYFLLKIAGSSLTKSRYYCIGADDGETELKAMDAEGSATVDAHCAEYQEAVDAMTPFTTADLSCASSDLNPGGTGTAAEGAIFLDFEE